ncbi:MULTISPECIES: hypothetical protein, partial [unclassified Legionella]|uniref:hypothetical protein n=1 Tax=unclassified Legionella TaxID=2622702 RepID=UPI003AF43F3F
GGYPFTKENLPVIVFPLPRKAPSCYPNSLRGRGDIDSMGPQKKLIMLFQFFAQESRLLVHVIRA